MIRVLLTIIYSIVVFLCLSISCNAMPQKPWPMWNTFKQYYISNDGRVIDPSSSEKRPRQRGKSYAMFFALVSNDQMMFDKLFHWTEDNLASGDLGKHLPAWAWGKNQPIHGVILDTNSAADADLWLAYDLLEAGRLWKKVHYTSRAKELLQRILNEEVKTIPGLGMMVLPGKFGFELKGGWRFNPSYLPPQLFARFSKINKVWTQIETNSRRMLMETSPLGFAPDWVMWAQGAGWKPDKSHPNIGSYDAIRVYLWIGMLPKNAAHHSELITHFSPIIALTQTLGAPPEKINILNATTQGEGPIGFSAALLPLLTNKPEELLLQRNRIDAKPITPDEYYNSVLRLFGQGWDQNRFRFNAVGELEL